MNTQPLPSKPHYPILDGLRGVASFLVVIMHVCEAHSTSSLDMLVNHGYLAVDFFFLLSGFVIGYAYDDRWTKMTISGFFKRRLIRLQPMVVMGSVIGAIFFYFQDSAMWPAIHTVPVWKTLLIMVIGATLIPIPTSMDIRGWQEMHPLDGPAWSLFFEYIANILYALFIRRFSKTALSILVFIAAVALVQYAVTGPGDVIGGWSITGPQLRIGFTRLIFPFFAGLLLSRTIRTTSIPHAFLWCSILLTLFLAAPRFGGDTHRWWNGLYESGVIIIAFPLIVYMGAGGRLTNTFSTRLCKFCGDISYPLYITHYPLIYTYTGWLSDHRNAPFFSQALPRLLLTIGGAILLAYGCLKLYDEPVRRWLQQRRGVA